MTRYATAITLGMLGLLTGSATACPFCAAEGQTYSTELNEARIVVVARPISADIDKETTEIEIETVIKDDPSRGKKTRFVLSRYIDPTPLGTKGKFLFFCEIYKDKLDAYRGMFIKEDSKLPAYCQKLVEMKGKSASARL